MLKTYGDLHTIDGGRGLQINLTGLRMFEHTNDTCVQVSIAAPGAPYPGAYVYLKVADVAEAMEW